MSLTDDESWQRIEAEAAQWEPLDYFEDDDGGLPLWIYTWGAGRETGRFDCHSGSRSDADRQFLDHAYSLGLSRHVGTYAEAEAALTGLKLDLDLSGGGDPMRSLDLAMLANVRAQPVQFAIEGIAPLGEVTLFTGAGSAGKSLLMQQLCTVAAASVGSLGGTGTCLGLSVKASPALYVTCEDSAAHLHFRQERLCEALGVNMADLAGRLHIVSLRGALDNELEGKDDDGNYSPSPTWLRLVDKIKATKARLVALDNVAHLFAGNENDRHDVTRFVNLLNKLAGETGAAIILIGHPPKSSKPGEKVHDYSGSTAWLNAVRSQFSIEFVSELDPDARRIRTGKSNYAKTAEGDTFRWHAWAFVRDEDLPADTRAEIAEVAKMNGDNETFLRCLRARMESPGREVGPAIGPNYAPARFAEMTEAKGVSKKRFAQAMERLLHVKAIVTQEVKRKGSDTKVIIVEAVPNPSEPAFRTASEHHLRTVPNPQEYVSEHTPYTYGIRGAGPNGPPAPDDEDPFDPSTWRDDG